MCVGFQLLYEGSTESPGAEGLGVFPGTVGALPPGVKHPQMQWNQLEVRGDHDEGEPAPTPAPLRGLGRRPWVYFVHSFAPPVGDETVAVCDYGGPVAALVSRGNLWGAQFHPEKSGATGLALLRNFVDMVAAAGAGTAAGRPGRADGAVPGHRPARRRGRAADPGRLRPRAALRRPGGAGASATSTAAPAGSTSSTSTRARTGVPHERAALSEIVRLAAESGVRVQTGGGIRSEEAAAELLASGVARVVLGTAALEDPGLAARCARRWPGRVAVGLDYRVGDDGVAEAQAQGWEAGFGPGGAGVARAVGGRTVRGRRRARGGPGRDPRGAERRGTGRVAVADTELPVVASGGVGATQDLYRAGAAAGGRPPAGGAIVGKALVEGRFSVEEGVAACAASG